MRFFFFVFLAIFASTAQARRWEFGCKSLDGKISFNRSFLNIAELGPKGKPKVASFYNLNMNNDPAYADEWSPLAFGLSGSSKTKPLVRMVNLKPGQDTSAKVKLNRDQKFCAPHTKAYLTTFRVVRKNQASFVAFHCEEAWIQARSEAERCQWEPMLTSPTKELLR